MHGQTHQTVVEDHPSTRGRLHDSCRTQKQATAKAAATWITFSTDTWLIAYSGYTTCMRGAISAK